MDTFPGSRAGTFSFLENVSEVSAEDYNTFEPLLRPSRSTFNSVDGGNNSPIKAGTKLPSVAAVFGGPMLESPCSSRVGTMDESAALLVESTPCSPSPSLPRTLTRLAKKRPSPLQPAQSVEVSQHADAEAVTPTPTPTTPSALVRAFGAMIKSRFL